MTPVLETIAPATSSKARDSSPSRRECRQPPLETFLDKFHLFADAPDAVAKIRELVLELAVRGLLLSSRPADPSAASYSYGPFRIPDDWQWIVLSEAADCRAASKVDPASIKDSDWVLDLEDIDGRAGRIITTATFAERRSLSTKASFQPGDVLYGKLRPYLNKVVIADRAGYCTTEIIPLRPQPSVAAGYLRLFLRSPHFLAYAAAKNYGMKMPRLGTTDLGSAEIPLPPLAEQKRIVAKVDELMALCDRLEAQQQERETRHAVLARASLARFADAPTPANLKLLFHPSYTISPADLRKSILTLAVQGKLVPQDPNDEATEDLVARLAQQRRAKNVKDYPPVNLHTVPFDPPYSWSWVRLGNLALSSDSGWSPQCRSEKRSGDEWGVLKVSAVSWGAFDPEANKALPLGIGARPECEVRAGDFLLSRANTEELVARSVVVEKTPPRLMMSDKIVRFTFPDEVEKSFINLANLSDHSREYYRRNASGTSNSMKNIGREVMSNLPIALPPLTEQRRIVAKVEQLMALVDALEQKLAASRSAANKLLEALVAELAAC
jgi:type I restriction enzyme, S subunit